MKTFVLLGTVLGLVLTSGLAQAQHASAFKKNSSNSFVKSQAPKKGVSIQIHLPKKQRRWVEGFYETRSKQVYHPGRYESVWIDPIYEEYDLGCGRTFRVCVQIGRHEIVWREGYYTIEYDQVYVPGHWIEC